MCKVRSFERDIWLDNRTVRARGIVTDRGYILAVDSIRLEIGLSASQIGMDEKGKFAVLEKGEHLISDGSIVVEIEPVLRKIPIRIRTSHHQDWKFL